MHDLATVVELSPGPGGEGIAGAPRLRRIPFECHHKEAAVRSLLVRQAFLLGLESLLLPALAMGLVLANGAVPDRAMAKMDPPKTKVAPPNRLPQGTNCYRSAGQWTRTAPDGSLWTCNSNSNGSINTEDCACVSGCKKHQPTPTPSPRPK